MVKKTKENKDLYYQHGDVLIKTTTEKAKGKILKTNVLKSGSNNHTLQDGSYVLKKDGERLFLEVKKQTTITHPEHKPIDIPKGKYVIGIVYEYDHFLEESKEVVD